MGVGKSDDRLLCNVGGYFNRYMFRAARCILLRVMRGYRKKTRETSMQCRRGADIRHPLASIALTD
ncbi:hypothetical protein N9Y68_00225 [Luminiphilus sp.]|nr:hypothetical protein [Luminiphilus sp.]